MKLRLLILAMLLQLPAWAQDVSMKAYGNTEFGMTKAQYYASADSSLTLSVFKFSITPEFFKDSLLTNINLESEQFSGGEWSKALGAASHLESAISKQYGSSKFWVSYKYEQLKPSEPNICAAWELGDKRIILSMIRKADGNCYCHCSIFNSAYTQKLREAMPDIQTSKF